MTTVVELQTEDLDKYKFPCETLEGVIRGYEFLSSSYHNRLDNPIVSSPDFQMEFQIKARIYDEVIRELKALSRSHAIFESEKQRLQEATDVSV